MSQGPMNKETATSGPNDVKNDQFKTLPQKDSRVLRKGFESGDGKVQGSAG